MWSRPEISGCPNPKRCPYWTQTPPNHPDAILVDETRREDPAATLEKSGLHTTMAAMRLSGLQRDVLALYRQCLRESRKKPEVHTFARKLVSLQTHVD